MTLEVQLDNVPHNGKHHEPIAPLLRWVGGKRRLRKTISGIISPHIGNRTYVEPFLGAGSVYFYNRPRRALLADANADLIEMYRHVRSKPGLVARHLRSIAASKTASHYYETRDIYNARPWSSAQAARFIFLNRTCFNGVFRVNRQGEFNVPFGRKENPLIPNTAHLRAVSAALLPARLKAQCFRRTIAGIPKHAFVYLDPPFPPLNGTAYFTHYTLDRFSSGDQEELADLVRVLDQRGIPFVMSNADTKQIRALYQKFSILTLPVVRFVSCKERKLALNELIITNVQRFA